jgi:hypothetical protein
MSTDTQKAYGPCPVHTYSWHELSRPCIRCLIASAEQSGDAVLVAGVELRVSAQVQS